jgi:hypothetical protein
MASAELVSPLDGADPTDADPNNVVRRYAANSAFRAATQEELTTEQDPYRRPVRPDDLAWLDYGTPMPADKALLLSWLLGNRMLRNVYDADLLHLPPAANPAAARHGREFYSDDNRVLGALAGPILERHLFTHLEGEREPLTSPELGPLKAALRAYFEERSAARDDAFAAALARRDRREAATFVLLQVTAQRPAEYHAIGRGALGEYTLAHPTLRGLLLEDYVGWSGRAAEYGRLLDGAGLKPAAAAYWQLYLGTSLARGNHLLHLSRAHEHAFGFLGAWVHKKIDDAVTAERYAAVFEEGLGQRTRVFETAFDEKRLDALVEEIVQPLVDRFGPAVITDFHAGFEDARRLAELWNRDLSAQITWADDIPAYMDRAERIQQHITDNDIKVDLDTFVESCEETSTTHVHDEHRLVMIEVGQMHFWNNVTHQIKLEQGDKLLIPLARLHGSVVLSGSCTYHQPIIPEAMYQRF